MQVAPNHKFACWYFSYAPVARDVPEDAAIEEGVYVARNLKMELEAHWTEGLGSFLTREIKAGGFALYVTAPSVTPRELDAENEGLRLRCDDILNGLLLRGVVTFQMGMVLIGANVEGEIQIRSFSRALDVEPTWESEEFRPGLETIRRAINLGTRLREMQEAGGEKWGRLLRAVRVLLSANRTSNSHGERFHQFVRALDGVVKTRERRGAWDFAHRVQTFAVASPETQATFIEMYNIRGGVEHLNSMIDAVPDVPPFGLDEVRDPAESRRWRIGRVNRLTRQIDVLARFTLCRILEPEKLSQIFSTEEGIDHLWALQNHERAALWGNQRLDMRSIR